MKMKMKTPYLTKDDCLKLLGKCMASSVQKLTEIHKFKKLEKLEKLEETDGLINSLQKEVSQLNKIVESVNDYMLNTYS